MPCACSTYHQRRLYLLGCSTDLTALITSKLILRLHKRYGAIGVLDPSHQQFALQFYYIHPLFHRSIDHYFSIIRYLQYTMNTHWVEFSYEFPIFFFEVRPASLKLPSSIFATLFRVFDMLTCGFRSWFPNNPTCLTFSCFAMWSRLVEGLMRSLGSCENISFP
ncbi:hypothetical protein PHYBLDRAFT_146795 [Phycomyces blakesleeanus NRRL 1555(-)]|uniref:Uncharacterized protein n=1 Tax=Phycomyces blakesleeanus (strain ATCC 8743b / DSM 1359 / FGSC 10004 / NBRC 33097 / NRRL 1555) TaxID=763407 RepID=A0A163DNY5_PHYB8|nr:hypothetical protein PHYBLDRAFT_146795 [Phycomyces blakesleeanus NRRL 1555(-)]OAD72610.1 hypothetical protein PHYBLDRAFT_146795 [Phycomyces blakesleeanus NRRL 1555(-)]|eukprot:XP_018290650.1 hypothetical protein PHYBLDRAFT_146795 [Phycomyces blakesleeanus NRRL 1555(-)]